MNKWAHVRCILSFNRISEDTRWTFQELCVVCGVAWCLLWNHEHQKNIHSMREHSKRTRHSNCMPISCNRMCALGSWHRHQRKKKRDKKIWKTDFHMVNAIWFSVETLNRYSVRNFLRRHCRRLHACVVFFSPNIFMPDSSIRHPKKCYICLETVIRYGSWMNKLPERTSGKKKQE